jgi:hypothetical protein
MTGGSNAASSSPELELDAKRASSDLPFADPADVVEVTDALFSEDDISSWMKRELQDTQLAMPIVNNVIRFPSRVPQIDYRAKLREGEPKTELMMPVVRTSKPPPLRRRFRYHIQRSFAGPSVSVAPAARSAKRFMERTALSDAVEPSWRRLAEVIGTLVILVLAIWVILS